MSKGALSALQVGSLVCIHHWAASLCRCYSVGALLCALHQISCIPHSKVHEANMGPIWGRQGPGGPHVGPMNFAFWDVTEHCVLDYVSQWALCLHHCIISPKVHLCRYHYVRCVMSRLHYANINTDVRRIMSQWLVGRGVLCRYQYVHCIM